MHRKRSYFISPHAGSDQANSLMFFIIIPPESKRCVPCEGVLPVCVPRWGWQGRSRRREEWGEKMQGNNWSSRFLKIHQGSVMGISFHPKVGLTAFKAEEICRFVFSCQLMKFLAAADHSQRTSNGARK